MRLKKEQHELVFRYILLHGGIWPGSGTPLMNGTNFLVIIAFTIIIITIVIIIIYYYYYYYYY